MTIDEAIKILTVHSQVFPPYTDTEKRDAEKLGIEALKCVKDNRSFGIPNSVNPLQGETK